MITTMQPRERWMDLLRGMSIVLVVIFHSGKMLARVDLVAPAWISDLTRLFALYRMPTLMFLSGLLLPPSLLKGWRRYFSGKARNVAWPLMIWSGVYAIVFSRDLGPRLIQSQNARAVARATPERKLAASLS